MTKLSRSDSPRLHPWKAPRAIRGLPWRAATETAEPRNDGSCTMLRQAADRELLRRLRTSVELELPLMAVVATFKAPGPPAVRCGLEHGISMEDQA